VTVADRFAVACPRRHATRHEVRNAEFDDLDEQSRLVEGEGPYEAAIGVIVEFTLDEYYYRVPVSATALSNMTLIEMTK